jgi:hypothetical protein
VAKVGDRLAVSKRTTQILYLERFILKELSEVEGKGLYQVKISKRFAALESLDDDVDISRVWKTIRENIKISAKENLGYYKLKQHKPRVDEGCLILVDQSKETNQTAIVKGFEPNKWG